MSLKEITKPEDFIKEIIRLNDQLEKNEGKEYIAEIKAKLAKELTNLQNEGDIEEIRKNLMRIETDIKASEIMSSIRYKEISEEESKKLRVEVSKIVDSLSDEKEETIRRPSVRTSKRKRYFPLNAMKGKINKIITYIKESEKFNFKNKTSDIINKISDIMAHIKGTKELKPTDNMNGIIDLRNRTKAKREKVNLKNIVMEAISTLKYKPQHAKQNKYVAKGKEMAKKIRALSSNVAKSIVAKASLLRKKITRNLEESKMYLQSKIESIKEEKAKEKEQLQIESIKEEKAKRKEQLQIESIEKEKAKEQEQSEIESIKDEKTTLYYRPKVMKKEDNEKERQTEIELKEEKKVTLYIPKGGKSKRYTAEIGTKKKIMHLAAAAVALLGVIGSMTAMTSRNVEKNNNSIYRVTPEFLEGIGNKSTLGEETSKVKDTNKNAKPSQDKNNTSTNLGQNNTSNEKPSTKPVQNNNNNSKPNQSNSNKQEINNNNKKPSQSNSNKQETNNNSKPEENNKNNEIKKIYGGEISASENGIRTEEDILYAVKKIGWSKDRVENIKEMMPGLLKMQTDFDIDPLCALAIFQWESGCGIAYEPGAKHYERDNDFRLANIKGWPGQTNVEGFSNGGYAYHDNYANAAYDFGNYVRNAKHYAKSEKGAQTMADLEKFDGLEIFAGAGTKDASTYNLLKSYLEKRITKNDVKKIAESCSPSEIKDLTNSLINKQKSASKAMAGR